MQRDWKIQWQLLHRVFKARTMENQTEKNMEHEIEIQRTSSSTTTTTTTSSSFHFTIPMTLVFRKITRGLSFAKSRGSELSAPKPCPAATGWFMLRVSGLGFKVSGFGFKV